MLSISSKHNTHIIRKCSVFLVSLGRLNCVDRLFKMLIVPKIVLLSSRESGRMCTSLFKLALGFNKFSSLEISMLYFGFLCTFSDVINGRSFVTQSFFKFHPASYLLCLTLYQALLKGTNQQKQRTDWLFFVKLQEQFVRLQLCCRLLWRTARFFIFKFLF